MAALDRFHCTPLIESPVTPVWNILIVNCVEWFAISLM